MLNNIHLILLAPTQLLNISKISLNFSHRPPIKKNQTKHRKIFEPLLLQKRTTTRKFVSVSKYPQVQLYTIIPAPFFQETSIPSIPLPLLLPTLGKTHSSGIHPGDRGQRGGGGRGKQQEERIKRVSARYAAGKSIFASFHVHVLRCMGGEASSSSPPTLLLPPLVYPPTIQLLLVPQTRHTYGTRTRAPSVPRKNITGARSLLLRDGRECTSHVSGFIERGPCHYFRD